MADIDIENYTTVAAPEGVGPNTALRRVNQKAIRDASENLTDAFVWDSHPWGSAFGWAVRGELDRIAHAASRAASRAVL